MCVRLVRLLCPSRHCVIALTYESPDGEPIAGMSIEVVRQLAALVAARAIKPYCGVCGSRVLTPQDAPTRFASMVEAAGPEAAAEQSETARWAALARRARDN
jgi:hypothetical protein